MTGSTIAEVQPGEFLGSINFRDDGGAVDRNVAFLNAGILPASGVEDPAHTHAFIATHRINNVSAEQAVVVLEEKGSGEGIVGLRINQDAQHDVDFLQGVLKITMSESKLSVVELDERSGNVTAEAAAEIGFEDDGNGHRLFRPVFRKIVPLPRVA